MLDLTFVYGLFLEGMALGAGLGAIAWILGYAISFLFNIIKRS